MRRTSKAAGIETMKYAAKYADCTSMASAYDSVNSSLSFGMSTSFKLVIPPKAKNSANTNTCKSGAYLTAAVPEGDALSGAAMVGCVTRVLGERIFQHDGLLAIRSR